jgi:hypothetical protein
MRTYIVKVKVKQAFGAQRVLGRLRLPESVTSALEVKASRVCDIGTRRW